MDADSAGPSTPGILNSAWRIAGFSSRKRGRDVEADPVVEELSSERGRQSEEISRITKVRIKSQPETEHLRATIKEKDNSIQSLEKQVRQFQEAHGQVVKERDEYFRDISKMTIQHQDNVQTLLSQGADASLTSELLEAQQQRQELEVQLKEAKDLLESQNGVALGDQQRRQELEDLIESQKNAALAEQKKIRELEGRLKEADETSESQKDATEKKIQELEGWLKEADEIVQSQKDATQKKIQDLEGRLKEADKIVQSQKDTTQKKIQELEGRLKEADETSESQKDTTEKKIQELEGRLKEADEIVQSQKNTALRTEQQLIDERATIQALNSAAADREGVQEQLNQMQKTNLDSRNTSVDSEQVPSGA